MRTVTVKKDRLLATLKSNLAEHEDQVAKAQEKFRERAIEELDKRLAEAKAGGQISLTVNLPIPQNYADEYRAAIEALDWELASEVTLAEDEFRQLVLNEWHWARAFAGSTQVYLAE